MACRCPNWQAVSFCTKRTPLVGGHPPIPRELSCGQAARQRSLTLSMVIVLRPIKKRADSSLMTATCPLIIDISLSCFLLFSSLLLIDLQEPVDVLFCDLVVHHLLLDRAILLIKLSLFCKEIGRASCRERV